MTEAMRATETGNHSYFKEFIPADVQTKLEAGAFRALVKHLQERSDEVANIDLMTLSGFCRNCLAKWMVVEARNLSDEMRGSASHLSVIKALDALSYDEAAREVYGMSYPEWKSRHVAKASEDQLEKYNESKPLHAKHDKELMQTRSERPTVSLAAASTGGVIADVTDSHGPRNETTGRKGKSNPLSSNVCCEPVEVPKARQLEQSRLQEAPRPLPVPIRVQTKPPKLLNPVKVGVLTVSDRASANLYENGDVSGPAVEKSLAEIFRAINEDGSASRSVQYVVAERGLVADETEDIVEMLKQWSGKGDQTEREPCDLILTTGGTGFSPRDITPEATRVVLDHECPGLMAYVTTECARTVQPLAVLSRATAGLVGNHTIVANLPGNPAGVSQVMHVLLPLLLNEIHDIQRTSN